MIDKSYYDNIHAKNVVHNYNPRDISSYVTDNSNLENMIINSNLENENIIK